MSNGMAKAACFGRPKVLSIRYGSSVRVLLAAVCGIYAENFVPVVEIILTTHILTIGGVNCEPASKP